jgi:hypothetical protein
LAHTASESAKNKAYEKGYRDAQKGVFSPPKGDAFVDFFFAPLDKLSGSPSTKELADTVAAAYREGHAAGSRR